MTNITVPDIPFKEPMTDARGVITQRWAKWFLQMFERVGGNIALSNGDIEDVFQEQIEDLQADVEVLQDEVSDLVIQDELNQGPVL